MQSDSVQRLKVQEVRVDEGPRMKRAKPRSRGQRHPYYKTNKSLYSSSEHAVRRSNGSEDKSGWFSYSLKRGWKSRWYANKQEFGTLLLEDKVIREFLMKTGLLPGNIGNQHPSHER